MIYLHTCIPDQVRKGTDFACLKTKFHYTDKITNFSKQNKFKEKDVI